MDVEVRLNDMVPRLLGSLTVQDIGMEEVVLLNLLPELAVDGPIEQKQLLGHI
jgi:hypothetical protein